ncbi:hypothetical protein [Enterococcus sp. BWR-S5]|uniref:hypothetical protein n=1 Tax=Enterococcus sp. BWR-S5 TaxID=2787714 RepID=UPI0019248BF3|nr:hypothetical protein [Enterococcus sp. BWR-S5]MBL1224822.1 hypothetical protein [Enterococcus sp. BWR-S5]
MKKIAVLFILLLFSGCASPEEKAEKEAITTLESYGLTNEIANDFFGYANSSKLIFSTMTDINNSIKENGYIIQDDKYKDVLVAAETMEDYFSSLNPKKRDDLHSYLSDSENVIRSPILILDNIEDNRRTFTIAEAAMVWDMMTFYAKESISSQNLSEENLERIIQWYHENNSYTDLFKDAYEYKTK